MQKVLRLNVIKRNKAAKDAKQKALRIYQTERAQYQAQSVLRARAERERIKGERQHRREDWILGPLAPNRDAGDRAGKYGTVKAVENNLAPLPRQLRTAPTEEGWKIPTGDGWRGEGNIGNLAEGDRVCVVRGPAEIKGKIGKIKSLSWESNSLKVEGLNMADVEISKMSPRPEGMTALFQATELDIPVEDVLLVHRLPGTDRDVLVRHLHGGAPWLQRSYGTTTPAHTRYISGLDVEIPWPNPEAHEFDRHASDTASLEVDELTWIPSYYYPPLPEAGIMDELRNKYSKSRQDHESRYVMTQVLADARSAWYQSRGLLTPAQEAVAKKREDSIKAAEETRAKGLSSETMKLLVERRAKVKEAATGASGPAATARPTSTNGA